MSKFFSMYKKPVLWVLAILVLALLFSPVPQVDAAGAVAAEGVGDIISPDSEIRPHLAPNDVFRYYDFDQGSSVWVDFSESVSNGDTYYYRGSIPFHGRKSYILGVGYGYYRYYGQKGTHVKLYKIVKANGVIITPNAD